ncbi:hypothetical protein ig2599ANME_0058 [groundwater metagenome]
MRAWTSETRHRSEYPWCRATSTMATMIRAPVAEGSSVRRGFAPGAGRRDCNVPSSFKVSPRPAGGQVHHGGRATAGEVTAAKDSRVRRAVLIFLPLDCQSFCQSFSFRHGAPSADGGIMGLKAVQRMTAPPAGGVLQPLDDSIASFIAFFCCFFYFNPTKFVPYCQAVY